LFKIRPYCTCDAVGSSTVQHNMKMEIKHQLRRYAIADSSSMSCPVTEKQPLRTFSRDRRLRGPILKTFSNQRITSCRAVNIQPHKAPRRSLYSPPRRSLCSSAPSTSRDFEFIFRSLARRSTYFSSDITIPTSQVTKARRHTTMAPTCASSWRCF